MLPTTERRSRLNKDSASPPHPRERRNAYRIHIPGALPLQPVTFTSDDGLVKARLIDISRCGASTLLDGGFEARIGSYMPCNFGLPDGVFTATVEIRSSRPLKKTLRLGLLFSRLSIAEHFRIDQSIATLERGLLRYNDYFNELKKKSG